LLRLRLAKSCFYWGLEIDDVLRAIAMGMKSKRV
jgi:hypothetical protein